MGRVLKGSLGHWLRVAHTAVGVALAVSLVTGTFVLTDTIEGAYARASAPATGEVDLVVRSAAPFRAAGGDGNEREPDPRDRAVRGSVRGRRPVGLGRGVGLRPAGRARRGAVSADGLPVVGAAWTPDTRLVAGHSPGPGEVAIDVATARRSGLGRGDRVKVLFEGLVQEFAVGGVTRGNRIVSASLASFDLATAQRVLGKGGRLDAVSVRAEPGVSAEALRARVAAALPESYEVLTADQAARQAKESWARSLRFLTPGLMVLAGVALLMGGFIVFNTFSMVVAQRSRELGLLRALGASRRQVTVSVLGEAVLVGGAASAAGIGGGLGAARASSPFSGRSASPRLRRLSSSTAGRPQPVCWQVCWSPPWRPCNPLAKPTGSHRWRPSTAPRRRHRRLDVSASPGEWRPRQPAGPSSSSASSAVGIGPSCSQARGRCSSVSSSSRRSSPRQRRAS